MNLLFLHSTPIHHPLLKTSRPPNPKTLNHITKSIPISSSTIPARDRVIDFGKHRGRMLGTLPSTYLKWISKNLRARDYEEWANLADLVLTDPIYRDRIEWEFAERVLNGDVPSSSPRSNSAVSELLEISQRFGWDNDDKVGWKRIDYALLGTSKGGRIPRIENRCDTEETAVKLKGEKEEEVSGEDMVRRRERRDRLTERRRAGSRMEKLKRLGLEGVGNRSGSDDDEDDEDRTVEIKRSSPFPGRESLLRKALNRRRL